LRYSLRLTQRHNLLRRSTPSALQAFRVPTEAHPAFGGLIQGSDGNFYGTTYNGGANNYASIYRITPTGTLTTIYSFCSQTNCADGSNPYGALIQGSDGNFYGTTSVGGTGFASSRIRLGHRISHRSGWHVHQPL
jgi:uncharacterized repeat protein (TIGR03803 family)